MKYEGNDHAAAHRPQVLPDRIADHIGRQPERFPGHKHHKVADVPETDRQADKDKGGVKNVPGSAQKSKARKG